MSEKVDLQWFKESKLGITHLFVNEFINKYLLSGYNMPVAVMGTIVVVV